MVFTDGYFSWNSVDLSDFVREVHVRPRIVTAPDHNTMGTTGEKFVKVLVAYDLRVVFKQSYASAEVDATLAADAIAGTARAWAARPTSSAASATNPEYTGTGMITDYAAIDGAFGDVLGSEATIVPTTAGITRGTGA